MTLTGTQERNLRALLARCPDRPRALRAVFGAWTESRLHKYANDGGNTSNSPNMTAARAEILRRLSGAQPNDGFRSNGRSVGMFQQTPEEVGGGWGDLAGCMDPATSTDRFLAPLVVTDDPVYVGVLLTPTGSRRVKVTLSSPVAADVLRVQQPLAEEAESENYNAAQVAIATELVDRYFRPTAPNVQPRPWLARLLNWS